MFIDILARKALWDVGLDYQHGTGHGIGSFLNVHEGPIGIGMYREMPDDPGLQENMFVSNGNSFVYIYLRIMDIDINRVIYRAWLL